MEDPNRDVDRVACTKARIDDIFMVVVIGEFNAGKSTFLNSLLGSRYLKEGVLPTTSKICVLRHASDAGESGVWKKTNRLLMEDVEEMDLPLEWLKYIAVVDTPGTNALISRHEQITEEIIPRSDLVLFVTSAERPLTESESNFLKKISQWGKKVVVVINKFDILNDDKDKTAVIDYVTQNVAKILGNLRHVPVFPISSRLALSAKLLSGNEDPGLGVGAKDWQKSNLAALEEYLHSVLGQQEIIYNKLENSLTIADRIIASALSGIEEKNDLLNSDLHVLNLIDENMELFESDIDRDIAYSKQRISTIVSGTIEKAKFFFDNHITIFKPKILFDQDLFQKEFQKEVLSMDLSTPVDDLIQDMSDLISRKAKNQAKSIVEYVGNRPKRYSDSMIGALRDPQFELVRQEFLQRLKRDATDVRYRGLENVQY